MRGRSAHAGRGSPAGHRVGTRRAVRDGQWRPAHQVRRPLPGTGLILSRAPQESRLWTVLWSIRWRNACRGGQPGVNCGWLVDGQRILKLLPETPCAVPAIGVEISSPPGTVTGEGETPSHPAKDNSGLSGQEKSGATGKEETPSHRCGGNPGPPGIGQTLGPLVPGKAWCHLARGDPARGNLGPVAQGKLRGLWRRGNPESCAEKKALGRRRKGKLQIARRRGNPESRDEKKALSHPAKGKLDPFDLGETPGHLVKESPEPPVREILGATRLGGNPGLLAKRTARATGAGSPPSHPVIRSTGAPGAFLALVGGRAAQRTLRNRRDGAVRLGEAPPSHTWRGLVLCLPCLVPLCPTGQNRARTTRRPRRGHSRP
jgi:hypothetical protein